MSQERRATATKQQATSISNNNARLDTQEDTFTPTPSESGEEEGVEEQDTTTSEPEEEEEENTADPTIPTNNRFKVLGDNSTREVVVVGGDKTSKRSRSAVVLDPPSPVPQVDGMKDKDEPPANAPQLLPARSVAKAPTGSDLNWSIRRIISTNAMENAVCLCYKQTRTYISLLMWPEFWPINKPML